MIETTDEQLAKVMRAIYAVLDPGFEDVGQSLADMRFLDSFYDIHLEPGARHGCLEKMARATIETLATHGRLEPCTILEFTAQLRRYAGWANERFSICSDLSADLGERLNAAADLIEQQLIEPPDAAS